MTQVIRPAMLEPVRWASAMPERRPFGPSLISLAVGLVRVASVQIVASRCGAEDRAVKDHCWFQSAIAIVCGCLLRAGIVSADIQTITVQPGWNLISLQLQPTDLLLTHVLEPIDGSYDEVWTYDALTSSWLGFQPGGIQTLSEIEGGIGYLIHIDEQIEDPISFEVVGQPLTAGIFLTTGWNLVGYISSLSLPFEDATCLLTEPGTIFATFDPIDDRWLFKSVDGPEYINVLTTIEPGVGYWIKVPSDTLWTCPLLQVVAPNDLDFGIGPETHLLRIRNIGSDTLTWSISSPEAWVTIDPAAGDTTTETDTVIVSVDWSLLEPGLTEGTLEVASNGGTAQLPVTATKAPLDGHYTGTAFPTTVNGQAVQLPRVRLAMDIRPGGTSAVITAESTPFFPRDIHLLGSGNGENIILGSTFTIPPNDAEGMNMFDVELVRSLALRGSRTGNNGIAGNQLGDYVETIELPGVDPVVIRGTFELSRLGDLDTYVCPPSNQCPIPDGEEHPMTSRRDNDRSVVDDVEVFGDGLPDDWEIRYGLNPQDPCDWTNDPDGDGRTNCQEYLDRTNPKVNDAQPEPVSISGTITEKGGGPVANVNVTLHIATVVLTQKTDASGTYSFEDLVPGYYALTFGPHPGFSFSPTVVNVTVSQGPFTQNVIGMRHTTPETVDFVGAPLEGDEPLTVQFVTLVSSDQMCVSECENDEDCGNPCSLCADGWCKVPPQDFWFWNFGDGGTSLERDPLHTYETRGEYTVSLITNVAPQLVKPAYVHVGPPKESPIRLARSALAILGGHPVPCEIAEDCDDGYLCTADSCDAGFCTSTWIDCPEGQSCEFSSGVCVEEGGISPPSTIVQAVIGMHVTDADEPSASENYQLWVDDVP